MNPVLESIFGNKYATAVLMFLQSKGDGNASRIAKAYKVPVMGVQRQLHRMEEDGVLTSRIIGGARVFYFSERHHTVINLREFLQKELNR